MEGLPLKSIPGEKEASPGSPEDALLVSATRNLEGSNYPVVRMNLPELNANVLQSVVRNDSDILRRAGSLCQLADDIPPPFGVRKSAYPLMPHVLDLHNG